MGRKSRTPSLFVLASIAVMSVAGPVWAGDFIGESGLGNPSSDGDLYNVAQMGGELSQSKLNRMYDPVPAKNNIDHWNHNGLNNNGEDFSNLSTCAAAVALKADYDQQMLSAQQAMNDAEQRKDFVAFDQYKQTIDTLRLAMQQVDNVMIEFGC